MRTLTIGLALAVAIEGAAAAAALQSGTPDPGPPTALEQALCPVEAFNEVAADAPAHPQRRYEPQPCLRVACKRPA